MKILIIQTAFIGDVILATPLLEKLHQHYPNSTIDFLLTKGNESLLLNHPYINKVLVFDKKNKYINLLKLVGQVRAQHYDYVINAQRFFSSGLLTALSGAKLRVGFDKSPLSFLYTKKVKHDINNDIKIHEVERNLALISELKDNNVYKPKLYPSEENFNKIKPDGMYICIAPSSVWFTKQFPESKWVDFIKLLPDKYMIYLLGAKGDWQLCESIKQKSGSGKVRNISGELSFLESAALMKNAVMNYVNDSAPMHMASAVNAPVTAIYCSTIPSFGFTPLSDNSNIIETTEHLTCRPCGLHGRVSCPLGHFKCSNIDVNRLVAVIE